MDEARLSRFPHLSWLVVACPAHPLGHTHVFRHGVQNHWLSCSLRRSATVSVVCEGKQHRFTAAENTVRYAPARSCEQIVIRAGEPYHAFAVLLIPDGHLRKCVNEEGIEPRAELSGWMRSDPHGLARDIRRIVEESSECDTSSFAEKDEVARRIILRILQVNGCGTPDWHDDASVFDRRTMNNLVEYVDAHLKISPSLSDMAMLVGLSPSHFAKKFRQSTGLSFHRLINRRRIQAALESLTNPSQPLAHIALELGFSSQAHFTHVFSGLTGMTPANYRKHRGPTVG